MYESCMNIKHESTPHSSIHQLSCGFPPRDACTTVFPENFSLDQFVIYSKHLGKDFFLCCHTVTLKLTILLFFIFLLLSDFVYAPSKSSLFFFQLFCFAIKIVTLHIWSTTIKPSQFVFPISLSFTFTVFLPPCLSLSPAHAWLIWCYFPCSSWEPCENCLIKNICSLHCFNSINSL